MSFHEYLTIIAPIVSVFVGIWVGQHLSDRKENQRNKDGLRKIKFLLNHDYSRIYHLCKKREEKAKHAYKKLYSDDNFARKFVNQTEAHAPLLSEIIFGEKFVFFDEITKTSLNQLQWDELGVIVRTHNGITELVEALHQDWIKLGMTITTKFQESLTKRESEQVRINILRDHLKPQFQIIFDSYKTIWNLYEYIKKISWMNLDEAKEPSLEGGILQTKQEKKWVDSRGQVYNE